MALTRRTNVLVVDDDVVLLRSVERQLRSTYDVTTANHPSEALAHDPRYDVVLADYAMPEMNGLQFLSLVRKVRPGAARVLMSGRADLSALAGDSDDVQWCITKPWVTDELVKAIAEASTLSLHAERARKPRVTPVPVHRFTPPPTAAAPLLLTSPVPSSPMPQPLPATPGLGKVLVVDDSATTIEATQLALEDAGIGSIALMDPLKLVDTIRREAPDVVLLDVNMPAINGTRMLELLGRFNLPPTKVVLHSMSPADWLEKEAKCLGAAGFVRKDSDSTKLLQVVKQLMASVVHPSP
jgi:CheY-like chemotaxis protein